MNRALRLRSLRHELRQRFPKSHPTHQLSPSKASFLKGKGPWPTGLEAVDKLLPNGGFPGGRLSELTGAPSSGKTTIALHCVAYASRAGFPVAYVDLASSLYPPNLMKMGADLDQILIVRPQTVQRALKAVDILIRGRAFPLIILDWGLEPPTMRSPGLDLGSAIARLNGLLSMGDESLLVITNPQTARDPIRYYASVRLGAERLPWDAVAKRAATHHPPTRVGASHLQLVQSQPQSFSLKRVSSPSPANTGPQISLQLIKNKLGAPGTQSEVGFCGWQTSMLPLHSGFSPSSANAP